MQNVGTSLGVQWLRLQASNAGDSGSIPCQGTKTPTCLATQTTSPPPPRHQNVFKLKNKCKVTTAMGGVRYRRGTPKSLR